MPTVPRFVILPFLDEAAVSTVRGDPERDRAIHYFYEFELPFEVVAAKLDGALPRSEYKKTTYKNAVAFSRIVNPVGYVSIQVVLSKGDQNGNKVESNCLVMVREAKEVAK